MTALEQVIKGSTKLAPTSKQTYLSAVRDFVQFAGAEPSVWSPLLVEQWRDHLLQRGLDGRTVNLYLTALRYATRRCEVLYKTYDFARPAEAVRVLAEKHPKKHALTLDQTRALIRACGGRTPRDLRDRAMILIGIHAALRRRELCRIDLGDIGNERLTTIIKGGRRHEVSVQGEAWQALRRWQDWLRRHGITEGRCFRSIRSTVQDDWKLGESLSENGFYKALKQRARQAGLGHVNIHPHGLRHTHVWLALEAGVPVWRVQMVLGHKSRVMTLYYAEDLHPEAVGASFPSLIE